MEPDLSLVMILNHSDHRAKECCAWRVSSHSLWTGVIANDNSPLLDCIKEQSAIHCPIPNATLKSDWDVVKAVMWTVAEAQVKANTSMSRDTKTRKRLMIYCQSLPS